MSAEELEFEMTHGPTNRLRRLLIALTALGCSTASLGGALAIFATQQPAATLAQGSIV